MNKIRYAAFAFCLFVVFATKAYADAVIPSYSCAGDGQQGPVEAAPTTVAHVALDKKTAKRLAYYNGILAPRGWHCFYVYGSNGDSVFIVPQAIDWDNYSTGFHGPAIQWSIISGSTSGRFGVAEIAARIFPAYKDFVTQIINEEIDDRAEDREKIVQQYPFGPYPADKLIYRNNHFVEFVTPANADGIGTKHTKLWTNDLPVQGFASIATDDYNLFLLAVRLPKNLQNLTDVIVHDAETTEEKTVKKWDGQ